MKTLCCLSLLFALASVAKSSDEHQSLSKISMLNALVQLDSSASIHPSAKILGLKGQNVDYISVAFQRQTGASTLDWVGVFSPANISSAKCLDNQVDEFPMLCSTPIKYQFANTSQNYVHHGKGSLNFRLINQRADFAFGLFSGGLENPTLIALSDPVTFPNPKAPAYPRIALGKVWNEVTVTWTSGYSPREAIPFVTWGRVDEENEMRSPASTNTFTRQDMCGSPAATVGWRDPGFIHTSTLKDLWPSLKYFYIVNHKLKSGSMVSGSKYYLTAAPSLGDDSLQRVIIVGDTGKGERDGSNEYNNYQPGALNTTDRLIEDIENIDIVFNIGDLSYSNGYLSQWDQFNEQFEGISSKVPLMITNGNHERDWPNSGSYYNKNDSGGECGVPAQTMFNMPAMNRAKSWYSADYGMFHFCIADSEQDWQPGTEQYQFIEQCLANIDRQKQPWLIFMAHRVLGYSSGFYYANQGTFGEPMGRESLQKLWQKHKVDLAFYGHIHSYERTCPVYSNICVGQERQRFTGRFNATIHVVVGGGGSHLTNFSNIEAPWSVFKDEDYGFTKLTAYNRSSLLFEYKKSSDGKAYDKFWIIREYKDVLGCDALNNCPEVTQAW